MNNSLYGDFFDLLNSGTQGRNEIKVWGINNTIANNIAYTTPNASNVTQYNLACGDVSFGVENTGNTWANNLCYNGTVGATAIQLINTTATITAASGNILGQNPSYNNILNNDFSLPFGSLSMGSGTSTYGYPTTDLVGKFTNPNNIWMGAYQYPLTLSGSVYY